MFFDWGFKVQETIISVKLLLLSVTIVFWRPFIKLFTLLIVLSSQVEPRTFAAIEFVTSTRWRLLFSLAGFHSKTQSRHALRNQLVAGLVFLGVVLHPTCISVSLPEKQITRIQGACQKMLMVSVTIPRRTVKPLGPHESFRTDGTVGSSKILQSATAPQVLHFHRFG